jgi:hypothetical protein
MQVLKNLFCAIECVFTICVKQKNNQKKLVHHRFANSLFGEPIHDLNVNPNYDI